MNPNQSNLPYDKTDAHSIFLYSKGLLEKTLRDFAPKDYQPRRGRGALGQMVENIYFFLETNSNPASDFSDAGLELKCTPLKKGKNENLLIKERLVCNLINYGKDVNISFEASHFYTKCRLMLLLFYLYEKGIDNLDLKFLFSVLWEIPEKDLLIIRQDYETIINKIKQGKAHELSEGDTMYLGACRKGQKGDSLMAQPYSEQGAPRRAFSLKMAYMRTVLDYVIKSKKNAVANVSDKKLELVSTEALGKHSFDDILLKRFSPFLNKQYQTIAEEKGIDLSKNPKNKFAIIANAILASSESCFNVNRSEEFVKAGLTMKTIRVQANGNIKEAMSFENIDYTEVAECEDWIDSRLYELFSSRFMFVVFREKNQGKEDYFLDDVFFWTMPQTDLEWASTYWDHIKDNIKKDHISEEYWWKGRDRKKFHVRPKAQKSTDMVIAPSGKKAKKYCYWFNNDYVREIVENRNKERHNDK